MRYIIVILLSALVWVSTANAEPSSAVRGLMNQPASMFDLGIIRMRLYLDEMDFSTIFPLDEIWPPYSLRALPSERSIYYDRETNRIEVSVMYKPYRTQTTELPDINYNLCGGVWWKISGMFGKRRKYPSQVFEDEETKTFFYKNVFRSLTIAYFMPSGKRHHSMSEFSNSIEYSNEKKLEEEIIDIIHIRIRLFKDKDVIDCEGMLTEGPKITKNTSRGEP